MLDFLLVARKPLVHLGSRADLLNLRANHGGRVLVGYFPDLFASLKSRKVWRKFLDASYTFLEQDPFQNSIGGMGVVTSQNVALTLQLDASRPIRWDTTAHTHSLYYPKNDLKKLSPFIFSSHNFWILALQIFFHQWLIGSVPEQNHIKYTITDVLDTSSPSQSSKSGYLDRYCGSQKSEFSQKTWDQLKTFPPGFSQQKT